MHAATAEVSMTQACARDLLVRQQHPLTTTLIASNNENREVLLLLRQRVPRSRHHVRPQRRQDLPLLLLEMSQELQDEA